MSKKELLVPLVLCIALSGVMAGSASAQAPQTQSGWDVALAACEDVIPACKQAIRVRDGLDINGGLGEHYTALRSLEAARAELGRLNAMTAWDTCQGFFECATVLLEGSKSSRDESNGTALLRDARRSERDALAAFQAAETKRGQELQRLDGECSAQTASCMDAVFAGPDVTAADKYRPVTGEVAKKIEQNASGFVPPSPPPLEIP